jgi:hypothetical protein
VTEPERHDIAWLVSTIRQPPLCCEWSDSPNCSLARILHDRHTGSSDGNGNSALDYGCIKTSLTSEDKSSFPVCLFLSYTQFSPKEARRDHGQGYIPEF